MMLVRMLSASRLGVLAAFAFAGSILLCDPLPAQPAAGGAAARRLALLKLSPTDAKAVPRLRRALQDNDPVVARTAARLMVGHAQPDLPALKVALASSDMLVRRTIAMGLGDIGPPALDLLAEALVDPHVLVRRGAACSIGRVRPHSERVLELLAEAGRDEDAGVRETVLLVSRSFFTKLDETRLPKDGWKFRLDPQRAGEDEKWYAVELDDAAWDDSEIEQAWQLLGYDYVGSAWYRRTIELPARDAPDKVELAFGGVDESAWVWVNGQSAGEHDIGPTGWDKPFNLDVTGLVKWGEANQITVRAMNTAARGGIWRPIRIVTFALAE
jgi:hypothetical protein